MGKANSKEYEGGAHDGGIPATMVTTSMSQPTTTQTPTIMTASPPTTNLLGKSIPHPAAPTSNPFTDIIAVNIPHILISSQMNAQAQTATQCTQQGKENRPNHINLTTVLKTKTSSMQQLKIKLLPPVEPKSDEADVSKDSNDNKTGRCTFCPMVHCEPIINMMERHYCAHLLIPGYAPPSPEGIKKWAVWQMYNFCVKNKLPEVWAYLWENWYWKGW